MSKKIYVAKNIITMNPSQPNATHIAVDGDKIMAVGTADAMGDFADYEQDNRFADKIIIPGFVEGHSHCMEGGMWQYAYLGRFGRYDPDGVYWDDLPTTDAIAERLAEAHKNLPTGEPLICWGFDPLYYDGDRIDKKFLDAVVPDRPLLILQANFHLCTINSPLIEMAGITLENRTEGIALDKNGEINGELQEMAAMSVAFQALGTSLFDLAEYPDTYRLYAKVARRVGVTTLTDLYNPLSDKAIDAMETAAAEDDFSIRLLPAAGILGFEPQEGIAKIQACKKRNTDKLFYGLAKLMTDGSIQGFTARLKDPGYHNGEPNGIWNAPPEVLCQLVHAYHQAGIQLHIHTNGDEASELMIDAISEALTMWTNMDHRHTLQHCQMIDHAQLRRVKQLGICLNMFANHLYYWGDAHRAQTVGYERSLRLEPMATALRYDIPLSVHCDAPVTPLGPLFTMQCAVTRRTANGVVLGTEESVTPQQALEMVTINSAYILRMDHLVGSLEIGKYADMVALDDDPLTCDVEKIADIKIAATVSGGRIYDF